MAPCRPPSSSSSGVGLWAMTKAEAEIQYTTGQCKEVSCNGKNRCDKQETVTVPDVQACPPNISRSECLKNIQNLPKIDVGITSRCVNSWCRLRAAESSPSEGGASGQR